MPRSFAAWPPHILVLKGSPNLGPHVLNLVCPGPWGPACVPSPAAQGEGNGNGLKISVLSLVWVNHEVCGWVLLVSGTSADDYSLCLRIARTLKLLCACRRGGRVVLSML